MNRLLQLVFGWRGKCKAIQSAMAETEEARRRERIVQEQVLSDIDRRATDRQQAAAYAALQRIAGPPSCGLFTEARGGASSCRS